MNVKKKTLCIKSFLKKLHIIAQLHKYRINIQNN